VQAGPYVCVSVTDFGLGIDAEHLPHIFDPFYTTKHRGKGNGLGLSTVYGIVTQNRGCVVVETAVAKGSTFTFFLPQTQEELAEEGEIQRVLRESSMLSKTILLVEDDAEVRTTLKSLLEDKGFQVLEAGHGKEALALVNLYGLPIHLLLTDVLMPEMGGKELADVLSIAMPGLQVLFMSGYTQDATFKDEVTLGNRAFIQKPFTMVELISKMREVSV
jgi:CheY-like chemotaxis protein